MSGESSTDVLGMAVGGGEERNTDKEGELVALDYDEDTEKGERAVKVICLGDSAVGKSKLVERFLLDGYAPQQLSTYALTLYRQVVWLAVNKVLPYQSASGLSHDSSPDTGPSVATETS